MVLPSIVFLGVKKGQIIVSKLSNCMDTIECDDKEDIQIHYFYNHMCSMSRLLRDCNKGCLFPFGLVYHLTQMVCSIERAFSLSFNNIVMTMTWLLSKEESNWSFNMIAKKLAENVIFVLTACTSIVNLTVTNSSKFGKIVKMIKNC